MKNPFVYGSIPIDKEFCHRAEFYKIEKALNENKNVFIFGRKKSGKTSIIQNINIEGKVKLYCDFLLVNNEQDVFKILTKALFLFHKSQSSDIMALFKKYMQFKPTMTTDDKGNPVLEINPENVSYDSFKELVVSEKVVLIFDHVHKKIDEMDIEKIIQKIEGIQLVVIETNDFHGDKVHGEKFKKMVSFEIGDSIPKEYKKFVHDLSSELSFVLDDDFLSQALDTVGNISDAQLFFQTVFSLDEKFLLNESPIGFVIDKIVGDRKELFELICSDLSPNQMSLLGELSNSQNLKIYSKQFCDELGVSSPNSVIKIVQGLVNKGILYKKDANYNFFSFYFNYYLKTYKK